MIPIETLILVTVMIVQIVILIWEIKTIQSLVKTLKSIEGEVQNSFKEIKQELMPLINALNKASPFLEVFNAVAGIFHKGGRKYERKPKVLDNEKNRGTE